jgi:hypothetical protein
MSEQAPPTASKLERRRFLKRGLVGGAALVLAGNLPFLLRTTAVRFAPRGQLRLLTREEHAILAAVVARLCPGPQAGPDWPTADALDCAGKIDALMAQVHPDVGKDFRRLLRLLESSYVGTFMAASPRPFTRADGDEQDRRLEAWRRSRFTLPRSGYQAVKRLAHATYYSSPEVYARIGYPGPPVVPG